MINSYAVWPGHPYPLGATWDGEGVNFALFSEHASGVELCLFADNGRREIARLPVRWQTDHVWHCYLPEARPGWLYGYRVFGRYDPKNGQRFNPNKLLIDPYARAIVGGVRWTNGHFGYKVGHKLEDLSFDRVNNAAEMPKSRVTDTAFTWGDDRLLRIPWHETIIYELHVKGFTYLHPKVPQALRGTYAGLGSAPVIEYLKSLGVTAIELMPVHAFIDERQLVEKGLRNYWGYNSIGFFAPDMRYSSTGQVSEFKTMVKTFHSHGIEVILDVVYNHTAEGNQLGPTLSFRGIDNQSYYRLSPEDPRYYMDFTGCGNTLNMLHPRVLQLIMDSLRYWVIDMHVDGFRFDLASTLARELHDVNRLSAFFDIIQQDPVLSRVKLIAEPWDLGEGGYQVGKFPIGWTEWNGQYRDVVRSYWKGDEGIIGDLAYRLTGSSDLYGHSGRKPYASINFITAHDGFTLEDSVTYNIKHNEANGEENRDGTDLNLSWNCGVEGPTTDPLIRRMRGQQKRNMLATLLLSQGVPMILGGDEMGRTQKGNNNAYCHDDPLTWVNWDVSGDDRELIHFVQHLIRVRKAHRIFQRRAFLQGQNVPGSSVKDVMWLKPDGTEMTDDEWGQSFARCLGVFMAGDALAEYDDHGRAIEDIDFVLLLNAHHEEIPFVLPDNRSHGWQVEIDTSRSADVGPYRAIFGGDRYPLQGRSVVLLQDSRSERRIHAGSEDPSA